MRWAAALVVGLLVLIAACGDGGGSSDGGSSGLGAAGADAPAPADDGNQSGEPSGDTGISDASQETAGASRSCADVDKAALDALVPGLEPTDDVAPGTAELACAWEAPAGNGSFLAQLYIFEGSAYYYEDEISDAVPFDLCDRAFRTSEVVGETAVFLSGETVVQFSLAQIMVPDELEIPDGDAMARVEAFAGTLAEGIC